MIGKHVRNIFKEGELDKNAVWAKFAYTASDGKALNHEPMYMRDWLETIDDYLKLTRREILTTKGQVSHKQAIEKAHIEYDKYKKKQEELLSPVEQDFMNSIAKLEQIDKSNK